VGSDQDQGRNIEDRSRTLDRAIVDVPRTASIHVLVLTVLAVMTIKSSLPIAGDKEFGISVALAGEYPTLRGKGELVGYTHCAIGIDWLSSDERLQTR
jgi:hypothetical protein